jgi:cell division protein FtsL
MAKTHKRRQPRKKTPKVSKHDQIYKRKRSTAEKVMIVLGIVIALSMILSLVVSLASSSGSF